MELVRAAASGNLVVLVGAGASHGAGLPSWTELLQGLLLDALALDGVDRLEGSVRDELAGAQSWFEARGEELDKASLLRGAMGEDRLRVAIARRMAAPDASPTPIHRALARLGAIFLTTNYDDLLERALAKETGRPPRVVLPTDAEGLLSLAPGDVLKLHGSSAEPASIVISHEDYFRLAYLERSAWKKRLEALLQPPRQVLLVGYGYRDFDLGDVVDGLRAAYDAKLKGPFWLELSALEARARATAKGLQPIWLDRHDQAAPWLDSLADAASLERMREPVGATLTIYTEEVLSQFEARKQTAEALFRERDYERAFAIYEAIAKEAESLVRLSPNDPKPRRLAALGAANAGSCLLNLGHNVEAQETLSRVADEHASDLSLNGACMVASALAQLGDLVRARRLVPRGQVASPEDSALALAEAQQILATLEGDIPEEEPATAVVRLAMARQLIKRGDLAQAARHAAWLVDNCAEDALFMLYGLWLLAEALQHTILEDISGADPIPAVARLRVVDTVEPCLPRLNSLSIPSRLRPTLLRLRVLWARLTEDDYAAAQALRDLETTEDSNSPRQDLFEDGPVLVQAQALAEEGEIEAALALLPAMGHPWRRGLLCAQLTASAGRNEEALQDTLSLAARFPGRAPIAFLAAQLLGRLGRYREAIPFAEEALTALPARGYRQLLGMLFAFVGDMPRAWRELELLDRPPGAVRQPHVLRAMAAAAESVIPGRATELWERYLAARPEDPEAHLERAKLAFRLGELERVADLAWQAWTSPDINKLGPPALYEIAELQRVGTAFNEERRERIRTVATALHERFPGDSQAENFRIMLLASLGFPADVPPIDYDGLARHGLLQAVPIDDVVRHAQDRHRLHKAVSRAYRTGHLPFESLCTLTGRHGAVVLADFVRRAEKEAGLLSAPVTHAREARSVRGKKVLVGELELLLVEHLKLWKPLRAALGDDGKLVLFEDIVQRIGQGAAKLTQRTQPVALERLERLIELLVDASIIAPAIPTSEYQTDAAWAKAENLPLVDDDAPDAISPHALANVLLARGLVDREQHADLVAQLAPEAPMRAELEIVPARLALGYPALMAFFEAGAIAALGRLVPGGLFVGPEAYGVVRSEREGHRFAQEAAALAMSVHRKVGTGIAEGWIDRRARPEVPDLPPLKETNDTENDRKLRRDPLLGALGFFKMLESETNSLLLTADFFTAGGLAYQVDPVARLAWSSPDAAVTMIRRHRELAPRVVGLPELTQALLGGAEAERALLGLAELGFVDALTPTSILRLLRRFGSSSKAEEPKRVLDHLEWMARDPDHAGTVEAQLEIARRYSQAIWQVSCGTTEASETSGELSWSAADMRASVTILLSRAQKIDEMAGSAVLDNLLANLAAQAMADPRASFEKTGNATVRLSDDSLAGRLWRLVGEWAGADSVRRAAFARGIRQALLHLDEVSGPGGPPRERSAPILLAIPQSQVSPNLTHAMGGAAILSATWADTPLQEVLLGIGSQRVAQQHSASLHDVVTSGARLAKVDDPLGEELHASRFPIAQGAYSVQVQAPSEAILLRISTDLAASAALQLAELQLQHDGRAYHRLKALAESPGDEERRRKVARRAVLAPWRLVREDPTVYARWEAFTLIGFPRGIKALRAMLSEPGSLPVGSVSDALRLRLAQNGAWAALGDHWYLAQQAMEQPGFLAAALLGERLKFGEEFYVHEVERSLEHLDHPDEVSAGRLSSAIFFLRAAAARRPRVALGRGFIDLRAELPERLTSVLRSVFQSDKVSEKRSDSNGTPTKPPTKGELPRSTLSDIEPGLLRVADRIVNALSQPTGIDYRNRLWLTYRLHSWFCTQMERIPLQDRSPTFEALRGRVPPPNLEQPVTDLLAPLAFSPKDGIDYRLVVVLYAIAVAEEIVPSLPEGERLETLLSVSSPALEELLAELASRSLNAIEHQVRRLGAEPSKIDWRGPGTVPDLALYALLTLRRGAFFDLPDAIQLRWLLDLPSSPDDLNHAPWFVAARILEAAFREPRRLQDEARRVFLQWLRNVSGPEESHASEWRWRGLTALFASGESALEAEVRALLLENIASPQAIDALAHYLEGLAVSHPDRMEAETEAIVAAATAAGVDAADLLPALGRVMMVSRDRAAVNAANQTLRRLAARPPFLEDRRVNSLLNTLGLR